MDLDCVSSAQELKKAQSIGAVVDWVNVCEPEPSLVRCFHVCSVSTCAVFPRVRCFHSGRSSRGPRMKEYVYLCKRKTVKYLRSSEPHLP